MYIYKFKKIKFKKSTIEKYKKSLEKLHEQGPITIGSKPYIGMIDIDTDKVVSCIWLDITHEISIVTAREYRRKGLMRNLINEIIAEVFSKRDKVFLACPLNRISKKLLLDCGFTESQDTQDILEFSL